MKHHLLVILQTHSKGSRIENIKRYCNAPKIEVSSRCVFSLIDSLNHAVKNNEDIEIEMQIFDDHSDQEFLNVLNKLISISKFSINLTSLETYGIMPSILRCYEHSKEYGKEWVYFIQDDFLFQENSIDLMLFAMKQFSSNIGKPVSIYPFNDPYEYYMPENTTVKSHIVVSKDRYWRTNPHIGFSFMTHIDIIKNCWDLFYKMATNGVYPAMEIESLCQIQYSRGYFCFTPIPSLTLHMQAETEKDFFIDWESWWNEYPLEKIENYE